MSLVMFRTPHCGTLAQSALADRLICWSRQVGHPLLWRTGAELWPAATENESYIWVDSATHHGSLICVDSEICDGASLPLVMYAGGPNLCPLSSHVDAEGVIFVPFVEALPRNLDCTEVPPPPPPAKPTITSLTPPCCYAWSGGQIVVNGTNLADATRVELAGGNEPTVLDIVSKTATNITTRHGEIEDDYGSSYQLIVTTPAGTARMTFKIDRAGVAASC